jgi:hypothetical protein
MIKKMQLNLMTKIIQKMATKNKPMIKEKETKTGNLYKRKKVKLKIANQSISWIQRIKEKDSK